MKKLILIMLLSVMLVGCSSIEDKAKSRMEKTLKELANDPSSVGISNVDVVFSTDSVVLIQCVMRSKNEFGTLVRSNVEYIYAIDKNCRRESIKNLDKEKSSIKTATRILEENASYYTSKFKTNDKFLEKMLIVNATINGRKIE